MCPRRLLGRRLWASVAARLAADKAAAFVSAREERGASRQAGGKGTIWHVFTCRAAQLHRAPSPHSQSSAPPPFPTAGPTASAALGVDGECPRRAESARPHGAARRWVALSIFAHTGPLRPLCSHMESPHSHTHSLPLSRSSCCMSSSCARGGGGGGSRPRCGGGACAAMYLPVRPTPLSHVEKLHSHSAFPPLFLLPVEPPRPQQGIALSRWNSCRRRARVLVLVCAVCGQNNKNCS